jgi:hypothetical protein
MDLDSGGTLGGRASTSAPYETNAKSSTRLAIAKGSDGRFLGISVFSVIMCLLDCTRKQAGDYWRRTYRDGSPDLQRIDAEQKADVEHETRGAVPVIRTWQELGQMLSVTKDKGAVSAACPA